MSNRTELLVSNFCDTVETILGKEDENELLLDLKQGEFSVLLGIFKTKPPYTEESKIKNVYKMMCIRLNRECKLNETFCQSSKVQPK